MSPPTTFPAAFCTAWQEAQNDSPYRLAPAVGSGACRIFLAVTAAVSPASGVLLGDQKSRNIARVRIAQLEVRHRRSDGVGLRILQPGINPFPRGLVGDVLKRRRIVGWLDGAAVGQFDGVTVHAAISSQQITSQVQLRCAGERSAMALSAGRLDVACRQDRLLPGQRAAVGFFDGGRRALPTVAHHAAELVKRVRNRRMPAERLCGDIGKTGLFQSGVAGGAAIDDSELRNPDLLDAVVEMTLQGYRVSSAPNQRQIFVLVVVPFTEVILGRRNGQCDQ